MTMAPELETAIKLARDGLYELDLEDFPCTGQSLPQDYWVGRLEGLLRALLAAAAAAPLRA
jgi:hypothetical protein